MKKFLIILLTALTLFTGCDQDGNNNKYNLTALDAKITEANLAKEGVKVATSATEVAQGRKWVESSDITTFTAAIGFAVAIYNLPISQAQVGEAVSDLGEAINIFKAKIKNGSKTSGFSQEDLNKLITEAKDAKKGVQTSSNGADIIPQENWVTSALMTALTGAITTAESSGGVVESKYTSLNTALVNFYNGLKQGTAASWRSITITGINIIKFPNGTEINSGLFGTKDIIGAIPQISGMGQVSNGKATIILYNNNNHTLWTTGEGSYYVGFMAKGETFVSKSKIDFNSTAPKPTAKFSDFGPYVYEYNCGAIATMIQQTIPADGILLDTFCAYMTGGSTYTQLLTSGKLPAPLYKDKGLSSNQLFTGIETIKADTMIYCTFDLTILMSNNAGAATTQ